jgi:hypothetical protein
MRWKRSSGLSLSPLAISAVKASTWTRNPRSGPIATVIGTAVTARVATGVREVG